MYLINLAVLDQKSDDYSSPVSLLSRPGSPRFFLIPEMKMGTEKALQDTKKKLSRTNLWYENTAEHFEGG